MLAFAAALLAFVQPAPQALPDTVDTAEEEVEEAVEEAAEDIERARIRPVFSPSTLYSTSKGFGVGGGVAVDDVVARGDHLQVEARISQRLQGGQAEYLTGELGHDRLVGVVGVAGWTTTRTSFVGHGPHSALDGELFLDRLAAEAEARLAWSPGGPRGVRLQPTVRLKFDRLRGFEERRAGGLAAVQPGDLARLRTLAGEDRVGVELALSAIRDTRDIPAMTRHGSYVEGELARFQALDESGLGFWRARATALAFRPALIRLPFLPERGALFVRATGVVTRPDGDEPLPWVYLPELDRDLLVGYPRGEFVGRDALSLGIGARSVVGQAIGAFLFEGAAMATVGAAYNDVTAEFTPRVRLNGARAEPGEKVPLSPSLAVGLSLHYLDRERPIVGALVGIGPGGATLASFRLVWGLGDYRPSLR
ncbi:hypothetical protein [Rubrivirga sp.]|uniref:hypothetical protein n=1 Tax=Rubrivirga sp. TaxID=1885344 RepID=UPI003B529E7D